MNSEPKEKREFQIPAEWLVGNPIDFEKQKLKASDRVLILMNRVEIFKKQMEKLIMLCDDRDDSAALAACMLQAGKQILLTCYGKEEFLKFMETYKEVKDDVKVIK